MKSRYWLYFPYIFIIALSFLITTTNNRYLYLDKKEAKTEPGNDYKIQLYYAYEDVASDQTNALNQLNYKICIFSEEELTFYLASNSNIEERQGIQSTEKYLYTQEYDNFDLPCVNKFFICTIDQFQQEYQADYSSIDFTVC
jgi:hypothetical protein